MGVQLHGTLKSGKELPDLYFKLPLRGEDMEIMDEALRAKGRPGLYAWMTTSRDEAIERDGEDEVAFMEEDAEVVDGIVVSEEYGNLWSVEVHWFPVDEVLSDMQFLLDEVVPKLPDEEREYFASVLQTHVDALGAVDSGDHFRFLFSA